MHMCNLIFKNASYLIALENYISKNYILKQPPMSSWAALSLQISEV